MKYHRLMDESQFPYTSADLQEAAMINDVTYAQWKARKYITSAWPSGGMGVRQRFSFMEIVYASVLACLVRQGVGVSLASAHTARPLYLHENQRTYLVLWTTPELDADRMFTEEYATQSDVVTETKLHQILAEREGCVCICLTRVVDRVKTLLDPSKRKDWQ